MAADQNVPPAVSSRLLREFYRTTAEAYSGGWGIGYFTDRGPMVVKEPVKATDSFALNGAIRRSEPGFVMAHVRNPTSGDKNILNTHPFQKDGWIFSHNGTLGDPLSLKDRLHEPYSDSLLGDTDSEVMFNFMLQSIELAGKAENGVLSAVRDLCRDHSAGTSSLNFALTDGTVLFVLRKAFINDEKYSMNFASLGTLGGANDGVLSDHGSSCATVISSEPFTTGDWTALKMDEMLIATVDGRRIITL